VYFWFNIFELSRASIFIQWPSGFIPIPLVFSVKAIKGVGLYFGGSMKWIKHYHNASSSIKLQNLVERLGVEGYGRYWLLLELLCEKYEGDELVIDVHFKEISTKIQINWAKKLEDFLRILEEFSLISFEISGKIYKIEAPILWKLKQKDFKRERQQSVADAPKPPLREKSKEKRVKRKDNTPLPPKGGELPLEVYVDVWNIAAKNSWLPRVEKLTEKRRKLLRAAVKEMPEFQHWADSLQELMLSDFHSGKNDRGWKADFDWFVQPTKHNYLKFYEQSQKEKPEERLF
jgi:hypothetical protein